jgi:hypothetical protein
MSPYASSFPVNGTAAEAFLGKVRTGSSNLTGETMLKKLLVAIVASAFALGAYAQAQKAEPKGQTGATTQPATPPSAKGDTKSDAKTAKNAKKKVAKAKPTKGDAKDSRKDATKKDVTK